MCICEDLIVPPYMEEIECLFILTHSVSKTIILLHYTRSYYYTVSYIKQYDKDVSSGLYLGSMIGGALEGNSYVCIPINSYTKKKLTRGILRLA